MHQQRLRPAYASAQIVQSFLCALQIAKDLLTANIDLSPVVQSIAKLTSLLMTNSFTAVATVFSNTLIFLLQKCE